MNAKTMRLLWFVPVYMIVSIGGSLLAVWVLSCLMGFTFNPSVVVVLSATICAVAIAISPRHKKQ